MLRHLSARLKYSELYISGLLRIGYFYFPPLTARITPLLTRETTAGTDFKLLPEYTGHAKVKQALTLVSSR